MMQNRDAMGGKRKLHIGIVGASLSGNRGAEAMIRTSIDQVRKRFPGAIIHLLSYAPDEDKEELLPQDCFLEDARPLALCKDWFIAGIIGRYISAFRCEAREVGRSGIRSLLKLDAVVDVFGVSFMDSRLKFIPFNVLSLWPFLLCDVPVFKLSQAMGPFERPLNRWAARWIFNRLSLLVARGEITRKLLEDKRLWGERCLLASDVAFLYESDAPAPPYQARESWIGLIPSSVVEKKSPDYPHEMFQLGKKLLEQGHAIKVFAHSWRKGEGSTRNNDLTLVRALVQKLSALQMGRVEMIGEGYGAMALKCQISSCRVIVTSRFHGMISSLETATPVMVIGWSHKYREIMASFGLEHFVVPYQEFKSDLILDRIHEMHESGAKLSEQISEKLKVVKTSSETQFIKLCDALQIRMEDSRTSL